MKSCVIRSVELEDGDDGDNAAGEMRTTLNESEGAVTSSRRDDVSLIFSWNKVFKPMHWE